jgi:hypothetical protein
MRFLLAAIIILLAACNNHKANPDVSDIRMDVKLQRFDRDFFSMDTSRMDQSIRQLSAKYPAFLPLYFEFLSPVNYIVRQQGKTYDQALREYYRMIRPLYDSTSARFRKMDDTEKELEEAFRYVKHYFPAFHTPPVLTSVESLNPENPQEIYGTTYFHDTLIISLQMFLGKDFNVYDPTKYFDYLRRRFEPEYIVPNSVRAIAGVLHPDSSQEAPLIDQMVEKGKIWYLLDHLLPNTPDSLKTFYTQNQLEWCRENEGNIWGYFSKNTDLYSVDPETMQLYIGEGPFTQGRPESSPGNLGQWVGWQIVKKYAERFPDLKLKEVLATPARKIFQDSKYKPK